MPEYCLSRPSQKWANSRRPLRGVLQSLIAAACLALCIPAGAAAQDIPPYVTAYVPDAEIVGKGRLSVLIWDAYDATLYAPGGEWEHGRPFALRLDYLVDLKGADISERSKEEMQEQNAADMQQLAAWRARMDNIFPDVEQGDSITGIATDEGVSIFYHNSDEIGRVSDPAFTRAFFNIWLSERTSEPELRADLLDLE